MRVVPILSVSLWFPMCINIDSDSDSDSGCSYFECEFVVSDVHKYTFHVVTCVCVVCVHVYV